MTDQGSRLYGLIMQSVMDGVPDGTMLDKAARKYGVIIRYDGGKIVMIFDDSSAGVRARLTAKEILGMISLRRILVVGYLRGPAGFYDKYGVRRR